LLRRCLSDRGGFSLVILRSPVVIDDQENQADEEEEQRLNGVTA
jgi:hypothetical protein